MTPAAPTAAELAADFFREGRWADPVEQLIFCDYLEDRCDRPLDAAIRRVLVQPWEDRHRLDYADAVEADGRVAAWREAQDEIGRLIRRGFSAFKSPAHDTEFERANRAEAELRRTAEHAAGRAEFVRVQCELAQCPGCQGTGRKRNPARNDPVRNDRTQCRVIPARDVACCTDRRSKALRQWQQQLLDADHRWLDWAGPLPALAGYTWANHDGPWDWEFRRGFVADLTLSCTDLLAHAGAVFACQPVTAVVISDREPLARRVGFRWYGASHLDGRPDYVPSLLARHLSPKSRLWMNAPDGTGPHTYPTADAALADLSAAAVALGRDLARLPPLPAGAAGR